MADRDLELNERQIEALRSRLANGTVKPEARDEMEHFEVRSRAANEESRGHTWE